MILSKLSERSELKVGSIVKNISLDPKESEEDRERTGFHFTATTLVGGVQEENYQMYFSRIEFQVKTK